MSTLQSPFRLAVSKRERGRGTISTIAAGKSPQDDTSPRLRTARLRRPHVHVPAPQFVAQQIGGQAA